MAIRIRHAEVEDADAIGWVHTKAWRDGYRGQLPDCFLDGLDPARRAEIWRTGLTDPDPSVPLLVAEDDGEIVGIASVGPARDHDEPEVGELWMINLVSAAWGRDIGTTLLRAATEELSRLGYREVRKLSAICGR